MHAQQLRRALDGYLSKREFLVAKLDAVDAALKREVATTPGTYLR